MTTLKAHERRITVLEETVISHGETLYKLRRAAAKNELRIAKVLRRLDLEDVTDGEVDEVLDAE